LFDASHCFACVGLFSADRESNGRAIRKDMLCFSASVYVPVYVLVMEFPFPLELFVSVGVICFFDVSCLVSMCCFCFLWGRGVMVKAN
jgi:hypothetical protein